MPPQAPAPPVTASLPPGGCYSHGAALRLRGHDRLRLHCSHPLHRLQPFLLERGKSRLRTGHTVVLSSPLLADMGMDPLWAALSSPLPLNHLSCRSPVILPTGGGVYCSGNRRPEEKPPLGKSAGLGGESCAQVAGTRRGRAGSCAVSWGCDQCGRGQEGRSQRRMQKGLGTELRRGGRAGKPIL